jgi:hypothetical protein
VLAGGGVLLWLVLLAGLGVPPLAGAPVEPVGAAALGWLVVSATLVCVRVALVVFTAAVFAGCEELPPHAPNVKHASRITSGRAIALAGRCAIGGLGVGLDTSLLLVNGSPGD